MIEKIQYRTGDNGENIIEGYGSIFESESKRIIEGGKVFNEIIHRGAFDNCDFSNVIMCINHDKNEMLARTQSNTLEVEVDDHGLLYRFTAPNTTLGNDTKELVQRGDYFESSFAFLEDKTKTRWERDTNNNLIKHIYSIKVVTDCSIVRNGAYAHTDISLREFQDIEEELDRNNKQTPDNQSEKYEREVNYLKLKYNIK